MNNFIVLRLSLKAQVLKDLYTFLFKAHKISNDHKKGFIEKN